MPIYEYRCTSCQDDFEVIQKMNDRPLRKCKKCSGRLEKQISRAAFQLKGDGWFASGYSKGSGKEGSAESKSSAESTSAADATSPAESKASATTSEPKPKKDAGKAGSGSGSGTKGKPTAASA